jgi:hypothetical protein
MIVDDKNIGNDGKFIAFIFKSQKQINILKIGKKTFIKTTNFFKNLLFDKKAGGG